MAAKTSRWVLLQSRIKSQDREISDNSLGIRCDQRTNTNTRLQLGHEGPRLPNLTLPYWSSTVAEAYQHCHGRSTGYCGKADTGIRETMGISTHPTQGLWSWSKCQSKRLKYG